MASRKVIGHVDLASCFWPRLHSMLLPKSLQLGCCRQFALLQSRQFSQLRAGPSISEMLKGGSEAAGTAPLAAITRKYSGREQRIKLSRNFKLGQVP